MTDSAQTLSTRDRYVVLAAGFLGWMLAGVQLAVTSVVMREAAKSLIDTTDEGTFGLWFGWLTSSFLLGAACGGYLFGWVGDRMGRKKAMAVSIACYSLFAGLTYFVNGPWQLLVLRFATGMGVGGMWPNGIALVSEAWPNMSRPMLAGVIGTAANVGIMLFSLLTCFPQFHITPDAWRWVMVLGATPMILAALVAVGVPESPRWLALRKSEGGEETTTAEPKSSPLVEIFRPPLLKVTIVGIFLGTIPLFGGWGNSNWANAWASQVGEEVAASEQPKEEGQEMAEERPAEADPALKARVLLARSLPGSIASLLGGAVATFVGRRRFYFLLALACFVCSQYMFSLPSPKDPQFLKWVAALGLFSGFFFGWLPLCLPELFPTRVRSTGAGVSFNFGRVATAIGIIIAAIMLKHNFEGNYAQIGRFTSLVYLLGMIVIWFAPDTSSRGLED